MLLPLMPELPPASAPAGGALYGLPPASKLPIAVLPTASGAAAIVPIPSPPSLTGATSRGSTSAPAVSHLSPGSGSSSPGPAGSPSGGAAASQAHAAAGGTPASQAHASAESSPGSQPSASAGHAPASSSPSTTSGGGGTGAARPGVAPSANRPSSVASAGAASASQAGSTGAAASPAAPSAKAPGASEKTRTVYARVGDDITIALNGSGWTFTGGGAAGDRWKSGVQYENRTNDSGGTTFVFKAKSLGSWVLEFQQQNSSTGAASGETIDLHVLTDQQFAQTLASKGAGGTGRASASGGAPGAQAGGLARADWLYKEGKYKEALDAYEAAWTPNDPALTDKIAGLAYRVGRYGDAHRYWQKNFGLTGTAYGELAVAGLMKTATAQKNAPELRALFDYVHALKGVPLRADLLATADYLYNAKDWEVAQRYLDEYLSRFDGQQGADKADYLLGQLYQGDTPMQNAEKALAYYRKIVTYYPTSDYYERAKANINYLNRHFFEIR